MSLIDNSDYQLAKLYTDYSYNLIFGGEVAQNITSGTAVQNVTYGDRTTNGLTTGSRNTAMGAFALEATTTANENSAFGAYALSTSTVGQRNSAVGAYALTRNTTGSDNVSVGASSLSFNTTGTTNTAVGTEALRSAAIANGNTAVGGYAMVASTTGQFNTAVGASALQANTTGDGNSALGVNACFSNTTGLRNTGVGESSLRSIVDGLGNSAIGFMAGGTDSGGKFSTLPNVNGSTALGAYAQVTQNSSISIGSVDYLLKTGVGITSPQHFFSVSPVDANSTTITATQSGTTVTASGAIFNSDQVGQTLIWADDGTQAIITGFTDSTHVTVSTTATKAGATAFRTHRAGLQVTSDGRVGINTSTPNISYALEVNGPINASDLHVQGNSVNWVAAPASSTAAGTPGQRAYDANYFYVCVATNTWKRTALSTW